jgi:broad specificity phosphatase PhoE
MMKNIEGETPYHGMMVWIPVMCLDVQRQSVFAALRGIHFGEQEGEREEEEKEGRPWLMGRWRRGHERRQEEGALLFCSERGKDVWLVS